MVTIRWSDLIPTDEQSVYAIRNGYGLVVIGERQLAQAPGPGEDCLLDLEADKAAMDGVPVFRGQFRSL